MFKGENYNGKNNTVYSIIIIQFYHILFCKQQIHTILKEKFMLISGLYTPAYCGTQSVAEAHLLLHRRTPASTEAGGLFLQRNRGHWHYMWLSERSTLSTPSDRKQKMRAKFMIGVEIKIREVYKQYSCFKLQTWSDYLLQNIIFVRWCIL